MKLGVFTPLFNSLSFETMLQKVASMGLQCVEIGTGGYPGDAHCDLQALLASKTKREAYLKQLQTYNIEISAFSCHTNPIDPNPEIAKQNVQLILDTIDLAALMNVPVVNTFSGVSGGGEQDTCVNWPVTAWPDEYPQILEWQWQKRLIPTWKQIAAHAEAKQIKIGIELHGGFLVHTPYTMLKLRKYTNEWIGANLDPSHLWWQGIDPVAAIKILQKENAIHHFHAKDTYLDQDNINMYGLLDMQSYGDIQSRAWTFRSVGCGHSMGVWNDMVSALRTYGYDYVMSIEHEDPLMSVEEGFSRAVSNLKQILIHEKVECCWWF